MGNSLIGGIIIVALLWAVFYINAQAPGSYYGMAILPMILISVAVILIGLALR